ncbi:FAD-dependent oxidoreductase [Uliginosibacterium paludis]|uniref:FAD-dependent oxidoreductase n=1 Tax=Uliginosibacterium paludis TaxID=1615952 RepID=A0ABV2CT13_9RHOO
MTTLLVFSHLRWGHVYQRPQHLLSRLAAHYKVLFIEEPVFDRGPARFECSTPSPGVEVLCPHTPVEAPGFHDDQLAALRPLLSSHLQRHGIDDLAVWFYTPLALPLLSELKARTVIYDCMDELSAFKDAPRQLRQRETALLKLADLVLTGGPSLYQARSGMHPNVHCLPSAVDAAHFSPDGLDWQTPPADTARHAMAGIGSPRLGFCGVIDERLDTGLLASLAEARPLWQFIMAGPVAKIDPASLPRRDNIHWLGMQAYATLPFLLARWDVCLMPFALNEATRFISPTKTLEYLSAGKAVVSTAIADVVSLYGDVVRIGESATDFLAHCDRLLARTEAQCRQDVADGLRVARRASWDRSAGLIHELIEIELHRHPAAQAPLRSLDSPAAAAAAAGASDAAPPPARGHMRPPRSVRQLIIGAGPTGLSAAYHLGLASQEGTDTLLIEREATVGGWCRSVQQQGFTFDHAGHIMFSNDADVQALYTLLLGDNVHWQDREAWIYSKGVHTRYPFQGSLYGLPPEVLRECVVGAIEARFGPLEGQRAAPADTTPPANFRDFIHKVWGKGIAKHFAEPYNTKLWTVPLEEMETSWLGGRVPLPDLEQMVRGALEPTPRPMGPNARFGYPLRGGFQALMDGFLPHLRCELALKTGVLQLSPSRQTVRLDDGRTIRFESLISTMPLPRLVAACGDEAPPAVRAAAAALRQVSVRCVNIGVGRENITDRHWVYYPEDTVFHRIFMQGNASPHCNPPGGFGFTCEISYSPHKPLPCEGEALTARVIEDCRRIGLLTPDDPILFAGQLDMPCAYVVYDHARAANVALIRDWLAGFGIVLAGRYSEWEYYNSDHAFLAGRRAAEESLAGTLQRQAGPRPASAQRAAS